MEPFTAENAEIAERRHYLNEIMKTTMGVAISGRRELDLAFWDWPFAAK